jgi:hypothetical protein
VVSHRALPPAVEIGDRGYHIGGYPPRVHLLSTFVRRLPHTVVRELNLRRRHETESIPLTEYIPIFRVPEYSEYLLRTGFVLGFRWEALGILKRGEKDPLRIVGLAQRTGRIRCLNLRRRLFLECNSGRGQDARHRDALQFSGRAIHFYNGGQVGRQEYSELSNSALLALSASAIGRNRQLGIFRNSEYRKVFR